MMTIAQRAGMNVGDFFRVAESNSFSAGSIVKLVEDDGTTMPLFQLMNGFCMHQNGPNNTRGAWTSIEYMEKIEMNETNDLITTLKQAENDYLAAKATFEAMKVAVSAELGSSFTLTHSEDNVLVQKPAPIRWKAGDILRCTSNVHHDRRLTVGKEYEVDSAGVDSDGDVWIETTDAGDGHFFPTHMFEWVRAR